MAAYDVGDSALLHFEVRKLVGGVLTLTNATVVLLVTKPDGSTTSPSVSNVSTGVYEATLSPDQAGTWLFRWSATGAATTDESGHFYVRPVAAANVYATLAELKARLSVGASDTVDDDQIGQAIQAASRAIDVECGRHFYRVTEARTLQPSDPYRLRLGAYMDLVSVTTLKTDAAGDGTYETTWATSDYQLLCQDGTPNVNAGPEPRPYQRIRAVGTQTFPLTAGIGRRADLVEVTGTWGWSTVPVDVREACLIASAELLKLKDAPFGVAGFGEFGAVRVRDNPKVMRLLRSYRLVEAAVPFA